MYLRLFHEVFLVFWLVASPDCTKAKCAWPFSSRVFTSVARIFYVETGSAFICNISVSLYLLQMSLATHVLQSKGYNRLFNGIKTNCRMFIHLQHNKNFYIQLSYLELDLLDMHASWYVKFCFNSTLSHNTFSFFVSFFHWANWLSFASSHLIIECE